MEDMATWQNGNPGIRINSIQAHSTIFNVVSDDVVVE
jgi:hypothetical protein